MEIRLPLKANPGKVLEEVKQRVINAGGNFEGTLFDGVFSILGVKGIYKIIEQELIISVISKPFFIPESFIRNEVMKHFQTF